METTTNATAPTNEKDVAEKIMKALFNTKPDEGEIADRAYVGRDVRNYLRLLPLQDTRIDHGYSINGYAPKFCGIPIIADEKLGPGDWEFRNKKGDVLAQGNIYK